MKSSSFFLTCEESVDFRGPHRCMVQQVCKNEGQKFYLIAVDPPWKFTGQAGIRGETVTQIIISTRRIEGKLAFLWIRRRISVNVFIYLVPWDDSKRFIETDLGRLYLFAIGVAHKTEKNALNHLGLS